MVDPCMAPRLTIRPCIIVDPSLVEDRRGRWRSHGGGVNATIPRIRILPIFEIGNFGLSYTDPLHPCSESCKTIASAAQKVATALTDEIARIKMDV
jgi:hypothetical protein